MSGLESSANAAGIGRRVIAADAFTFDALEAGPPAGPLVLLLHGWPEFADMWTPVIAALAADGRHAVAVDQRGYSPGARPLDVGAYTVQKLVGDIFAFADALGAERFDLVTHDWGGIVGWIAAGVRPDRVRSFTVFATPHADALTHARDVDPDQQAKLAYVGLHRAPGNKAEAVYLADDAAKLRGLYGGKLSAAAIDENVRRLTQPGALTATLNWYRALTPGDAPLVTVPTLFVWGSDDIALGERAALGTRDYVTGPYRFERLDGVSHWIVDEVPDTAIALVREHLAAYSPVPPA